MNCGGESGQRGPGRERFHRSSRPNFMALEERTDAGRCPKLTSMFSSLASPPCPHSHSHFGSPATHRAAALALTSFAFGFDSDEGKAGVVGRVNGAV